MSNVEYTLSEEMLQNIVSNAVSAALANVQLDNCISSEPDCSDLAVSKGEQNMASKIRKRFVYINENGEESEVRIAGDSEREINLKLQQFLATVTKPSPSSDKLDSDLTLSDFIHDEYVPTFLPALKPTTRKNYELYIKRYIIPFLGSFRLTEINVRHVQSFMNKLAEGSKHGLEQDLCEKTIERICGLCSRIFKIAVEMKKASDIPFKSALLVNKGKESGHHQALPDEELLRIKTAIPTLPRPSQRLYMGLLVYTGMRREEILGLRWEDVQLDERYATISRAVTYPDNHRPHVDTPKSKSSYRTILLAQPLCNILSDNWQNRGFIFGGDEPLSYTAYRRLREKCFSLLEIVGYSNHDFRATFGTQLKEKGLTSAQVADLLGHADTRMVETVYARTRHEGVMKNLDAIDLLNASLGHQIGHQIS